MKPQLRRIHSPDAHDLSGFQPSDPAFAILIQLLVGPSDGQGEESFDVVLCSPEWLSRLQEPLVGRHHIIVQTFNYEELVGFIEEYLEECEGKDWQDVAERVGRLGKWEFEDYRRAT